MEDYIASLNEAQRAPVLQKEGPMMIIAGAGSGKTRVLTYRIAHLMQQGVSPKQILSLTFTNKAAREMKERIASIVGKEKAKQLWMGTFHSVFAKILRIEAEKIGFPSYFTIYDAQDSQRLIATIVKELVLDKELYKPKQLQSRISSFKNNLVTVDAYFADADLMEYDSIAKRPRIGEVYKHYVDRLFKAGAMDFDDLLLKTYQLLTSSDEVLQKYQDRFQYILVDEYQDTNHSQYLIVKSLADRFQNLCVVGDDAQSIYAFRGANINNIFNFQKDYKKANQYRLEQNYRSTKTIVNAANSVIDKNKTKLDKSVWTANDMGAKIKVNCLLTDTEEGRYVGGDIFQRHHNEQCKLSDFTVLYRTNAQSRVIEDALRKRNLPYRIYGGLSFYQRKEVKDVLAYLRLIINPKDEEALKRIINYPARGIGATTISKLVVASTHYGRSVFEIIAHLEQLQLKISKAIQNKLKAFASMVNSWRQSNQNMDAFALTELVLRQSGLQQDLKSDTTPEGITRMDNVEELLNGIRDFVTTQQEENKAQSLQQQDVSIETFLEEVALVTDLDNQTQDEDCVALMTIHLAKGLEFPYVYIVGMEEELFPSAMSMGRLKDLEEERRLFYVALTRAEKEASLTYTTSRYRWGKLVSAEPSRFIGEIDSEYLEFLSGINPRTYYNTPTQREDEQAYRNKLRLEKPKSSTLPKFKNQPSSNFRRLKKIDATNSGSGTNSKSESLTQGSLIEHPRFGKGRVVNLSGLGNDTKVEVQFDVGGLKKLMLRFTNLKVLN